MAKMKNDFIMSMKIVTWPRGMRLFGWILNRKKTLQILKAFLAFQVSLSILIVSRVGTLRQHLCG